MGRDDTTLGKRLGTRLRRFADRFRRALRNVPTTLLAGARRHGTIVATVLRYLWHFVRRLCVLLFHVYTVLERFGHRRKQELQNMPGMLEIMADDAENARRVYDTLTTPSDADSNTADDADDSAGNDTGNHGGG